jgi:hypothetical protein
VVVVPVLYVATLIGIEGIIEGIVVGFVVVESDAIAAVQGVEDGRDGAVAVLIVVAEVVAKLQISSVEDGFTIGELNVPIVILRGGIVVLHLTIYRVASGGSQQLIVVYLE